MVAAEKSQQKYPTLPEVVEELKRMADIGFPIATMSFVGYLKNMIQVICMGRLGSLELAGGALAIGFTNITGYSVLSGLAMGMEPVCSQAFGSRNLSMAHQTLQRTILMLLLASIPITLLFLTLEPLMLSLQQNPDITRVASLYCKFAIPDLVANSFLHPIRIYLRSKGTTWPLMWCTLISIVLHLPITIFLAFNLSLGVKGIAISSSITNFINLFFLLCYTLIFAYRVESIEEENTDLYKPLVSPRQSITTISSQGSKEWRTLLGLAIPSCVGVCLEWWWYEFMTISAGYLYNPHVALAASAIVIQTTSLMYTLPTALSASVSTRVGNELGAGRPWRARLATVVSIGLALLISLFGLLWTTLGREAWGRVFTKDNEVIELTMTVLPIIGLCELANCPQTTCCGILRGSARPGIGAGINFYSFYLVGAPVAIVLAFVWDLGFLGLCYGLLAAQIACVLSILFVVYRTDWERESLKAKDLVGIDISKSITTFECKNQPSVVAFLDVEK
ncbi:MATE efflux family protein 5 [Tripterygium wilfordii]|uniref:Protein DETOXIFICATION n=1 Tax=Tripterygium wilfordii TaxID=458696 RepID=A0A7J7CSZ4_TRIWF|nr:protein DETOXIFICATION 55 [Tripterygium wilfordii]KAF5737006.1 MATE efflux family protein 5 [Tripterygium wilfordii]